MDKVKYPYKWYLQFVLSMGILIVCTLGLLSNPTHPQVLKVAIFIAMVITAIIINAVLGVYASVDSSEKIISRTDYFFITKSLNVENIKEVKFIPTWKFANDPKTLHIIGEEDGVLTFISFPQSGWRDKHLASMAIELKKLNPRIQFNDAATALMEKYDIA